MMDSTSENSTPERATARLPICGILGISLMVLQPTAATASELRTAVLQGTLGYDSQLWYGQFHPAGDEDQRQTDPSEVSPIAHSSTWTSPDRIPVMNSPDGTGKFHDTSLAEVLIDNQDLVSPVEQTGVTLSDWERTRIAGSGSASTRMAGSGGPTATTILVGFVAAIVVCGALFSRRESVSHSP